MFANGFHRFSKECAVPAEATINRFTNRYKSVQNKTNFFGQNSPNMKYSEYHYERVSVDERKNCSKNG